MSDEKQGEETIDPITAMSLEIEVLKKNEKLHQEQINKQNVLLNQVIATNKSLVNELSQERKVADPQPDPNEVAYESFRKSLNIEKKK